jgi:hypothetical protein
MGIDGVYRDCFVVSSQHYRSTEVNFAVPLSVASGENRSAQNLEWEWLTSQGTVSAFSVNDKWHEYLDLQLVPPDNLTQRQRSWRHGVMAPWIGPYTDTYQ